MSKKMSKFMVTQEVVGPTGLARPGEIIEMPEGTVWEGKLEPYKEPDASVLDAHAQALAERDEKILELTRQVAEKEQAIKDALEAAATANPDSAGTGQKLDELTSQMAERDKTIREQAETIATLQKELAAKDGIKKTTGKAKE